MQASEAPRWRTDERVRVGVSSCLLGERVRFDGGHKRDAWLTDVFGEYVEWVPARPEVEIGMGTPRGVDPASTAGQDVRLVAPKSGHDFTEEMRAFAARRANELTDHDLVGFVFKKASPSCGVLRVRIYEENGMPGGSGPGLFSTHVMKRWPLLPIEEEGPPARRSPARQLRREGVCLPKIKEPLRRAIGPWRPRRLSQRPQAAPVVPFADRLPGIGSHSRWRQGTRTRGAKRASTRRSSWGPWSAWPPASRTRTSCTT